MTRFENTAIRAAVITLVMAIGLTTLSFGLAAFGDGYPPVWPLLFAAISFYGGFLVLVAVIVVFGIVRTHSEARDRNFDRRWVERRRQIKENQSGHQKGR